MSIIQGRRTCKMKFETPILEVVRFCQAEEVMVGDPSDGEIYASQIEGWEW